VTSKQYLHGSGRMQSLRGHEMASKATARLAAPARGPPYTTPLSVCCVHPESPSTSRTRGVLWASSHTGPIMPMRLALNTLATPLQNVRSCSCHTELTNAQLGNNTSSPCNSQRVGSSCSAELRTSALVLRCSVTKRRR